MAKIEYVQPFSLIVFFWYIISWWQQQRLTWSKDNTIKVLLVNNRGVEFHKMMMIPNYFEKILDIWLADKKRVLAAIMELQ